MLFEGTDLLVITGYSYPIGTILSVPWLNSDISSSYLNKVDMGRYFLGSLTSIEELGLPKE